MIICASAFTLSPLHTRPRSPYSCSGLTPQNTTSAAQWMSHQLEAHVGVYFDLTALLWLSTLPAGTVVGFMLPMSRPERPLVDGSFTDHRQAP